MLGEVLDAPPDVRAVRREHGLAWARRFDAGQAIDRYLAIYERVLALESPSADRSMGRGATS
jgi:hypothetical protein